MKKRQIFITVAILIATSFMALYIYDFFNNADNIVNVTSNSNVVINNHISARTVTDVTSNMSNMSNMSNSTNSTVTTNSTVQQVTENTNTIPGWGYALAFGGFAVLILGGIFLPMYGLPTIPVTEAVEMASDINFRHSNNS